MIYADPSFLTSLYTWDANNRTAQKTYEADRRRPLILTPWQRFECRNAVRLAEHKLRRAGLPIPFQTGNILKRIDQDLSDGVLRHHETDWRETLRLAEELSEQHSDASGAGAVDLWHIAAAILLGADTFWTFDSDQRSVADAVKKFKHVPKLATA